MIAGTLVGLSLIVSAAVEPFQSGLGDTARMQMSVQQKNAIIQPLMRSATDCVVRAIVADPEFRSSMPVNDFNELIVGSMPACLAPMRAMIDAHDRLFGEGSGEAFFLGPYLDVLPAAVNRQVKGNAP
jgi:hypothetical protein